MCTSNVATQHLGHRLEPEIARRRVSLVVGVPFVPAAAILGGLDPCFPVASDVAHSCRWAPLRVGTLGVLTARHLESVLGAGELHPLDGPRRDDLEDRAAPADQVRGSGKDLHGGHAARQRAREIRVLGPDGMLGPDVRGRRIGRLVAVGVRIDARRGVDAHMRMHIDDPGRHVPPMSIDHDGVGRCVD